MEVSETSFSCPNPGCRKISPITEIEEDNDGPFMRCDFCRAKRRLIRLPALGRGAAMFEFVPLKPGV